jgi:hypothetical protein
VREPNRAALALHYLRGDRGAERTRRYADTLQKRLRRRPQRGRKRERVARCRRKAVETGADELL